MNDTECAARERIKAEAHQVYLSNCAKRDAIMAQVIELFADEPVAAVVPTQTATSSSSPA